MQVRGKKSDATSLNTPSVLHNIDIADDSYIPVISLLAQTLNLLTQNGSRTRKRRLDLYLEHNLDSVLATNAVDKWRDRAQHPTPKAVAQQFAKSQRRSDQTLGLGATHRHTNDAHKRRVAKLLALGKQLRRDSFIVSNHRIDGVLWLGGLNNHLTSGIASAGSTSHLHQQLPGPLLCPEIGCGLDENGNYVEVPSLKLPEGWIVGTVGAGDAFCSGVLYGAWKGMALKEAIELGTASAACSLSQAGATEGMRPVAEVQKLYAEMR